MTNRERMDQLQTMHQLPQAEWVSLLQTWQREDAAYAADCARAITQRRFGKKIYVRGIIEFTNYCRNDCLYCGIRRSNTQVARYRLSREEILACCAEGYRYGYRTFVLQGGEDGHSTDDWLCSLVEAIAARYPDCAITLSVGERSRASYQRLYDAGARRYLLRHETADETHYASLHPQQMQLSNRLRCLQDLLEIGYQTGCGMMVGTPNQSPETLAKDMLLLQQLQPQMVGIGPFLPHHQTPLANCPPGSVSLTLFLLSLTRLLLPDVLLPATTALQTAEGHGWQQGVLAGCNVVMPNLTPQPVRENYLLYDGKAGIGLTARAGLEALKAQMQAIGYGIWPGRGDFVPGGALEREEERL